MSVRSRVEYRVSWHRVTWARSSVKGRNFATREAAERFIERLHRHADRGLAPADVAVCYRHVGLWHEGWPS